MISRGVNTLGVVGAGQMGGGIAWVAALRAKTHVVLVDSNESSLQRCVAFQSSLFSKEVAKNRITQADADSAIKRITTSTDLGSLHQVDFVVEAAPEVFDIKREIFKKLSAIVPQHAILASNTSSISITKFQHSSITSRPEQLIGMHFMNPVPVMKLVEIIQGLRTSPETLKQTQTLAAQLGKITTVSADVPGFIANRILMPYINEAILVLETGVASKEDIDTTMTLGTNVPMGPLRLADFIGLDTCLAIMKVLHADFGDSKYRPATLLTKYVDAGLLGNKTGEGFFKYELKQK